MSKGIVSGVISSIILIGTLISAFVSSNPLVRAPWVWDLPIPYVKLASEVTVDGKIDVKDIAVAAKAFGSYPNIPRWNPIADINKDDKVDIRDIALIARSFGESIHKKQ